MPLWWWLALVPGLTRVGADAWAGRPRPLASAAAVVAPGLVVLSVAAWSHLSSRPLAVQLRKELRTFGAVALGTIAPGLALLMVRGHVLATVAGLALASTGGIVAAMRAFQVELEHERLNPWLLAPRRRRALVATKLAMVWLVFGAMGATLALADLEAGPGIITLLFLWVEMSMGPFFGQVSRRATIHPWSLLGAVLSIAAASWLDERLFVPAFVAWGLVCTALVFRSAWTLESKPPQPASLSGAQSGGRLSALWSRWPLFRKELTLESSAALLGLILPAVWLFWVVARRWDDSPPGESVLIVSGALVCFGVLGSMFAGASSFAEERALGTLAWQEALLPRRQLFWAKVAAVEITATVVAVIIPAGLVTVDPGWDAVRTAVIDGQRIHALSTWLVLALLPGALGILASIGQRDLTRAFLTSLGLGVAATTLVAAALGAVGFGYLVMVESAGSLPPGCHWRDAPAWLHQADALNQAELVDLPFGLVLFVLVLVGLARWLYVHGRGWRPWAVAAALSFGVLSVDFALKSRMLPQLLWEAMPHQSCSPSVSVSGPAPSSRG